MRRRLTDAHIGLGNSLLEIFNNEWTDNEEFNNATKKFFDDVLESIKDFKEFGGFDFSIFLRENGFRILFGLEPAYKHDPYICYCFDSDRDEIFIQKGVANGYYGSNISIEEEHRYKVDKFLEEFATCIDKHYDKLMACL